MDSESPRVTLDRRAIMHLFARARGALPARWNDALFHLPADVTDDTPALCRARGWSLEDLGPREERLPALVPGTREGAIERLRASLTGLDRDVRVFAAVVPEGRVLARACSAIAPDGIVLADVSPHATVPLRHHRALTNSVFAKPPVRLRGRSALVGAIGHRNFYHWMFDAIPRVALVRDAKLDDVERWIVPATDLPVAAELLARAGVPASRIHGMRRSDHVVCDELVVTSAPGEVCEPTARTVESLQAMLLGARGAEAPVRGDRRVYIARRGRRRVANEAELAPVLARHGVETVAMEGLSLDEQIARVRGASCVIAPHGAALAHIIHAARGATLVELLAPRYFNPSFFVLAGACGMRYGAIEGARLARDWRDPSTADFRVDADELGRMLATVFAQAEG